MGSPDALTFCFLLVSGAVLCILDTLLDGFSKLRKVQLFFILSVLSEACFFAYRRVVG